MIKRFVWFVGGAAAGVAGTLAAGRRVKRRVSSLAPVRLARGTGERVRQRIDHVGEVMNDGRRAMRNREAELKARLEGRATALSDIDRPVTDDDALLVDGEPIEPGRVVVLRDVTDPGTSRRRR
jgi:hypothetical protein